MHTSDVEAHWTPMAICSLEGDHLGLDSRRNDREMTLNFEGGVLTSEIGSQG